MASSCSTFGERSPWTQRALCWRSSANSHPSSLRSFTSARNWPSSSTQRGSSASSLSKAAKMIERILEKGLGVPYRHTRSWHASLGHQRFWPSHEMQFLDSPLIGLFDRNQIIANSNLFSLTRQVPDRCHHVSADGTDIGVL